MSWADDPYRATTAAIYGVLPELAEDDGIVANVTSSVENDDWVLIGDAVILGLNIIGSLAILVSMGVLEWRGRPSTTRTRLVQALILSDFLLGIVGLIGVSLALHPGGLEAGQACDGLGVVLVAILWSEHLWTMALAIATFLILILPLHPLTLLLEKRWWVLLIIIWSVSFGVSAAGYGAYGVVPSGGLCYYPSSSGLFGPLMQFIPRAFVFLVITILYAKLFVFLRRPDKIRSSYSNSPTGSFQQRSARIVTAPLRPIGVISSWFRRAPPEDFEKEVVLERIVSRAPGAPRPDTDQTDAPDPAATPNNTPSSAPTPPTSIPQVQPQVPQSPRRSHPPISPTDEIPPWEKVELPAFQIDGQRFGGSQANMPNSSSSNALWGNWKGLSGGSARESRKRPSTASSHSPPAQSTRKFGSGSSVDGLLFSTKRTSPTPVASPRLDSITSMYDPLTPDPRDGGHLVATQPHPQAYPRDARGSVASTAATGPSERFRQFSLTPSDGGGLNHGDARRGSAVTQSSRRSSGQTSPFQTKRDLAQPGAVGSEATMADMGPSEKDEAGDERDRRKVEDDSNANADPERNGKSDGDERNEHEEEDDNWDLMRMLQQSAPPRHAHDRFAPAEGETVELVEESMASYLNRKTALLMLWFPLGYILLFSVSLVRIIYDFVGRPPTALRALSRWFIFAQGILDAVIYGLVEWHTKRMVRRRVKKGTLSPNSHSAQSGSWPRALLSRRTGHSQNASATATALGAGGSMSQMSMSQQGLKRDARSSVGRQGVTFGRVEERSILREMDLLEEKDFEGEYGLGEEGRRGSAGVDSVDTKTTGRSGVSGLSGLSGVSGTSGSSDTGDTATTGKKEPGPR